MSEPPRPARGGRPAAASRSAQRTAKGEQTRARLLAAAEQVFAKQGFHDASMVKITSAAGVAQGTFYLYFSSKQQIFEEVIDDLNRRLRHALAAAVTGTSSRIEAERAGLAAFLAFTAEHPALYRIIHQADIAAPAAGRRHLERLARPYAAGLRVAMENGEIPPGDPEVLAWSLMAIAEMIGRRWVLWGRRTEVPQEVLASAMTIIERAIGVGTGTSVPDGHVPDGQAAIPEATR